MKRPIIVSTLLLVFVVLSGFQIVKTQLTVTVLDDLGNIVPGASVRLFEKEEDYNAEQNEVATGTTDQKGKVKFKDLKAIAYYMLVEKDDKNNFGLGEKTGKLEEKKINQVKVVIQE